jgi:hypothetical protein
MTTWVGWYRLGPSAPWRRACTADSLGEAHRRLLAHVRRAAGSVQRFLTTGRTPPRDTREEHHERYR